MSDALAVVVGIDRYPDEILGALKGAINDAEEFCAWLRTPAAGGLEESNSKQATEIFKILSIDDGSDALGARPMLGEVEEALERVRLKAETAVEEWVAGRRPAPLKRLYLFFAGHGIGPDIDQAALLMANAGRDRFGYYLQGRSYANYFLGRGSFDEVLLFMDCCRDRYPFIPPQPLKWEAPEPTGRDSNHCFAFATKWSKQSRETILRGKSRGLFSAAVVEGLKGLAADDRGHVTAETLEGYVAARVPTLAIKGREVQKADFDYPNPNLRPLLIADYGQAAGPLWSEVIVTLSAPQQNTALAVVDGDLDVAALFDERRDPPNRWSFRVPFGLYTIKNPAAGTSTPQFQVAGPEINVAF